ncbi:hypothetical protein OCUAc20_39370 [Acinetobacter baumannii]|nr:hypothetical protein OCUAc20_39370 [Acinetobacter baumannii]
MPHDVDLIILLAVGFGVALFFGYIAARLRLPLLLAISLPELLLVLILLVLKQIFILQTNLLNSV